jgi:phosphonatase-like hydrolase
MKEIKLIVLDMAGTTVNEDNVVYKTLRNALTAGGFDLPLSEVLEHGAGKEKYQAIYDILSVIGIQRDLLEHNSRHIHNQFKAMLKGAYEALDVDTFPGVVEFMIYARNRGIKIVLNTGYDRNTASGLIQKLGWKQGQEFDDLVTADDVSAGRPGPGMIFEAMRRLNISDVSTVLKAGDSAIDIEEGKNANCGITVGVLSGAQDKNQLQSANPDFILNSVADLQGLLFGEFI